MTIASPFNGSAIQTALSQASVNSEPGLTLFKNTTIGGRPLGDINNSGTVSSFDTLQYSKWRDGSLTDTDYLNWINNTMHPYMLSNPSTYASYITPVSISLSQIQTEFGGSNPISLSEYYRDGGIVRSTYPDGSGPINGNIPTSGVITMANFYNGQGVFVYTATIASNYANYNLNSVMSSAGWDGVKPVLVNITINAGVTVYGVGYGGTPAFTIGSLPTYSAVTVTNNGIIAGYGGYGAASASAGGPGGVGMSISHSTTLVNSSTGAIFGGGGGGGGGGAGPEYGTARTGGDGGAGGDAIIRYANLSLTNNGIIGGGGGGGGGGGSTVYDANVYEGGGGGAGGRTGYQGVASYGGAQGASVYYLAWTRIQNPTAGSNGLTDYAGISLYDVWQPSLTGGAPMPGVGGTAYTNGYQWGFVFLVGSNGGRGGSVSYNDQNPWAGNGFPGQGGQGGTLQTQGAGGLGGYSIRSGGGTLSVVTYGTIWGTYQ